MLERTKSKIARLSREKEPAKTTDIDQFMDAVTDVIINLLEKLTIKVDLEEFLEGISENIDQLIIDACRREYLVYYGGKMTVVYLEDKAGINIECYFKNRQDKWIKKQIQQNISIHRFTETSIRELKFENEIKFDIEAPTM